MKEAAVHFDHVHLISRDAHTSASWYVEKLNGKIDRVFEIAGAPQIYVSIAGFYLIIRGQREGETTREKERQLWGIDHFGLFVSGDFDGYCNHLKTLDVKFTMEPVDFSPESRIAYIEAPDGIRIELVQRKKTGC